MGKFRRIVNIIAGVVIILYGALLMFSPERESDVVIWLLGTFMLLCGIRQLFYFFNLGIHMVGGIVILYKGVICLDLGIYTLTLKNLRQEYIMIYLLLYYIVTGFIDIYRALEAKKLEGPWKFKFFTGAFCLVISVICAINLRSLEISTIVLSCGFIYSGVMRIISATRRTAIVYIQ